MSDTIVVHGGEEKPTGGQQTTTDKDNDQNSTSQPSAPSAPAVDPIVAQRMNLFQQVYISLWGEPATEAYLKQAANAGVNSWEFAARERAKPEWAETKAYGDKARGLRELFANLGVG